MHEASARNLRTVERFLLAPPLSGKFGTLSVAVCDISARGARFLHDQPVEMGKKGLLRIAMDGQPATVSLEGAVVWTEPDPAKPGRYVSGVRTYGSPGIVAGLMAQLQTSNRSNRIEELRGADRFFLSPSLEGRFAAQPVRIENLSARGARIETKNELVKGISQPLAFRLPEASHDVVVSATVMWTAMKAITGSDERTYRSGLFVSDKHEMMRLSIGQLCELGAAVLDTTSLVLKLKILRARVREFAPSNKVIEASGIPNEQYLLIQSVREELRLNPEEAMHWYRRARLVINDAAIRKAAPMIIDYPDALAVWEYLDRSIDPSVIGRAFALPKS